MIGTEGSIGWENSCVKRQLRMDDALHPGGQNPLFACACWDAQGTRYLLDSTHHGCETPIPVLSRYARDFEVLQGSKSLSLFPWKPAVCARRIDHHIVTVVGTC